MHKTHMLTLCLWVTINKVITQAVVINLNSYFTHLSCRIDWRIILSSSNLFLPRPFQIEWDQVTLLMFLNNNGNLWIDPNQLQIKQLNMQLSVRHQLIIDKNQLPKKIIIRDKEIKLFSRELINMVVIILNRYHHNSNLNLENCFY